MLPGIYVVLAVLVLFCVTSVLYKIIKYQSKAINSIS
jgi:hypothetical protein